MGLGLDCRVRDLNIQYGFASKGKLGHSIYFDRPSPGAMAIAIGIVIVIDGRMYLIV